MTYFLNQCHPGGAVSYVPLLRNKRTSRYCVFWEFWKFWKVCRVNTCLFSWDSWLGWSLGDGSSCPPWCFFSQTFTGREHGPPLSAVPFFH